jgi:signal transduction histidine kinase
MNRMIADLLDLARARQGGGIPVSPQRGDLAPVLARVIDEQRQIHPSRRIEVSVTGDTAAECDWDRIAQLLSNLLGNALRHGSQDAPVRVDVDGRSADEVIITIRNRGRIEPALLAHLFDPFRSGADRMNRGEGLGLGLYIAHQIARAHRGDLSAAADTADEVRFVARVPRSSPNGE